MKQEHYIKVVNDVVHRMERHADVVMNVKQVAEYLGLSVGAVRKRCQRNQLPGAAGTRSRIGLTLAIRNFLFVTSTSLSYVLLRLMRFCFFLPAAPKRYLSFYHQVFPPK